MTHWWLIYTVRAHRTYTGLIELRIRYSMAYARWTDGPSDPEHALATDLTLRVHERAAVRGQGT